MSYTVEDYILTAKVTNSDVATFARKYVNLPPEKAQEYRARADSLGDRLEKYIADNPEYNLVKMIHSGSVAKGTALLNPDDQDLAVYVKADEAPQNDPELVEWLIDRLKEVLPTFSADQFEPQEHCVKLVYANGPSIDMVPVIYKGEANYVGYLVIKGSGRRVMTSIPLHLDFIRKRKSQQKIHFAQFIRLVKYWIRQQKEKDDKYRFKSMMAELLCAHLCDNGLAASDYTAALQAFFAYIVRTGLKEPVFFTDYYKADRVNLGYAPIQIFDPVNPENNIATKYSEAERLKIVASAQVAFDAVTAAPYCTTKAEAVSMWQKILGPAFQG